VAHMNEHVDTHMSGMMSMSTLAVCASSLALVYRCND